jgi:hypothetical protein
MASHMKPKNEDLLPTHLGSIFISGQRNKKRDIYKPGYLLHEVGNHIFSTTEDLTTSGVVKGVKPFFMTSESVQLIRAISNITASFFR